MMFGSDWPVCLWRGTYPIWVEAARELTNSLSLDEKEAFFSGTARAAYKLKN